MTGLVRVFSLFLIILIAVGGAAALQPTEDVVLGIPANPPLTQLDERGVSGLIAETTVLVLRRMGHSIVPRKLPFARMYKWVHNGKLDVATSVLRTEKRAQMARYTNPIISEYTVVAVPKGKAFPMGAVDDLKHRRIGAIIGFSYPGVDDKGIMLIRETNYEKNLIMVAKGRLDGALISSIAGIHLAKVLGLQDQIEYLPVAVDAVPLGSALSKKVFSADDLERFNVLMRKLKSSEEWQKILTRNDAMDLVKTWPLLTE